MICYGWGKCLLYSQVSGGKVCYIANIPRGNVYYIVNIPGEDLLCGRFTIRHRHFYICMHHGPVWIHEEMMIVICSSMRICELKYIVSFIIVIFISPIKDVMLESVLNVYLLSLLIWCCLDVFSLGELLIKNWMHSFEVSLGYESVDRSTFSMKRYHVENDQCFHTPMKLQKNAYNSYNYI